MNYCAGVDDLLLIFELNLSKLFSISVEIDLNRTRTGLESLVDVPGDSLIVFVQ